MSEILKKLQESAQNAINSTTKDEAVKHLANAFTFFSLEVQKLNTAHQRLQDRFESVSMKLKSTEDILNQKVSDLSAVTAYLNNLIKNTSQGIIFIDKDLVVTTYNTEAFKILGTDPKKVLFNNYQDNFEDDFFGFSMKDAFKFKSSKNINYIRKKTDSEFKDIEISSSYISDSAEEHQGLIILLNDITKMQKLKIQASRNDKMKEIGEITSSIVNEMKNPLSMIRGYASLLGKNLVNNKNLENMTIYILDGIKSIERVVNNVSEYAKPIKIDAFTFNIKDSLKEIIKTFKKDDSFSKNINIDFHYSDEIINIFGDKNLIKNAISKILINSYQAIEDYGNISISLMKNNDLCIITISDDGAGIEDHNIEKIFSLFFTTKSKAGGLGLCEANKIISSHFGSIEVKSVLNKGTIFNINLPIKN